MLFKIFVVCLSVLSIESAFSDELLIKTDLVEGSCAPWEVRGDDLINNDSSYLSSVSGYGESRRAAVTDGGAGPEESGKTEDADIMYYDNMDYSITYDLDIVNHPKGYDIAEINTYAGWSYWRINQIYQVYATGVDGSTIPIAEVSYLPIVDGNPKISQAATRVSLRKENGSPIATNVASVTFELRGDVANPQSGIEKSVGAMYREFDVIGRPAGP